MNHFKYLAIAGLAAVAVFSCASTAQAQTNGSWYPYVIARGTERDIIHSLPIEERPNRPLHFYGNTVRRINGTFGIVEGLPTRRFSGRMRFDRRIGRIFR